MECKMIWRTLLVWSLWFLWKASFVHSPMAKASWEELNLSGEMGLNLAWFTCDNLKSFKILKLKNTNLDCSTVIMQLHQCLNRVSVFCAPIRPSSASFFTTTASSQPEGANGSDFLSTNRYPLFFNDTDKTDGKTVAALSQSKIAGLVIGLVVAFLFASVVFAALYRRWLARQNVPTNHIPLVRRLEVGDATVGVYGHRFPTNYDAERETRRGSFRSWADAKEEERKEKTAPASLIRPPLHTFAVGNVPLMFVENPEPVVDQPCSSAGNRHHYVGVKAEDLMDSDESIFDTYAKKSARSLSGSDELICGQSFPGRKSSAKPKSKKA